VPVTEKSIQGPPGLILGTKIGLTRPNLISHLLDHSKVVRLMHKLKGAGGLSEQEPLQNMASQT